MNNLHSRVGCSPDNEMYSNEESSFEMTASTPLLLKQGMEEILDVNAIRIAILMEACLGE